MKTILVRIISNLPKDVTLVGMITEVRLVQLLKALSPCI